MAFELGYSEGGYDKAKLDYRCPMWLGQYLDLHNCFNILRKLYVVLGV